MPSAQEHPDSLGAMSPGRRRALTGAYATFALFTVLAGQFWRNLLGWWGFGAVVAVVVVGRCARAGRANDPVGVLRARFLRRGIEAPVVWPRRG